MLDVKWSYADSPYCAYGWEYFNKVSDLYIEASSQVTDFESWFAEFMDCMERVMKKLAVEGLFNNNVGLQKSLINAEIMPPDSSNTARALRLNDEFVCSNWLNEAAE